jgi:RNA polymerase sigma-70 factor (ECF subfamily)
VEDAAAGPSVLAESAALGEALLAAIAMLPQTQREVFLLKAEGELTLEEIAAVTVAPYETVKSRLKYANRALREKLGSWR